MRTSFPLRHWLTTLFLSPFICDLIDFFSEQRQWMFSSWETYPFVYVFSFLFSIPAMIVYTVTFFFLYQKEANVLLSKLILIILSVSGIIITQTLISGSATKMIIISYSISAVISGIIWKLKKKIPARDI